jgi:hypothetical protein
MSCSSSTTSSASSRRAPRSRRCSAACRARRLPADAGDRDGPAPGAHHLDAPGLGHLGAGDLRPGRRPHRSGAGEHLRPPRRVHHALAADLGEGDLPGDRPARLDVPRAPAGHRLAGALRDRDPGAGGLAALQGPAGHHRHPRHGRALRRGPADRAARAEDRALPLAADVRRRGVHRPARQVRAAGGDDQRLHGDPGRQARRPPRAGLLHGRHDRGGGGQGRGEAEEPEEEQPDEPSAEPEEAEAVPA